ncbi:hypothetical protein J6590_074336 [Homalodisca vitripennis]|nr:hypothetical protein J6590_074336 [Homalodisca vitripennis]
MSLMSLPLEVLEILFLHLEVEDLPSVLKVVGMEGSDSFWMKVCKREGFKKIPGEEEDWRDVFQRNINWITETYRKREYKFQKVSSKPTKVMIKDTVHGKHLLIKGKEDEVFILNLENDPEVVQKLSADYIQVSGSKLYTHISSYSNIYSKKNNKYTKLVDLIPNPRCRLPLQYALSNDYLTVFEDNHRIIWITDFSKLDQFSVNLSHKVMPVSLFLQNAMLNVLVIEMNQYAFKRFNLHSKEWMEDVVLFKGAALVADPNLHVSQDLIVGWCNTFVNRGITPLKVWNCRGELVKTLSVDFITSFGPIKPMREPERILWIIVEGEHVIISTSTKSLTIWNSRDPDMCKELPKSEYHYKGQCVISSFLLVLSYSHCFNVIDFKKAMYLYEVALDIDHHNLSTLFFTNEYFHITLNKVLGTSERYVFEEPMIERSGQSQGHSSTSDGSSNKLKSETEYTICIYDFRGDISLK